MRVSPWGLRRWVPEELSLQQRRRCGGTRAPLDGGLLHAGVVGSPRGVSSYWYVSGDRAVSAWGFALEQRCSLLDSVGPTLCCEPQLPRRASWSRTGIATVALDHYHDQDREGQD